MQACAHRNVQHVVFVLHESGVQTPDFHHFCELTFSVRFLEVFCTLCSAYVLFFQVLLNEKLESPLPHTLPWSLPSDLFTSVIEALQTDEHKQLLLNWYMEDENSVPKCHVLHAIRDRLPDIVSSDPSLSNAAFEQWQKELFKMVDALKSVLTADQRTQHLVSGRLPFQ